MKSFDSDANCFGNDCWKNNTRRTNVRVEAGERDWQVLSGLEAKRVLRSAGWVVRL